MSKLANERLCMREGWREKTRMKSRTNIKKGQWSKKRDTEVCKKKQWKSKKGGWVDQKRSVQRTRSKTKGLSLAWSTSAPRTCWQAFVCSLSAHKLYIHILRRSIDISPLCHLFYSHDRIQTHSLRPYCSMIFSWNNEPLTYTHHLPPSFSAWPYDMTKEKHIEESETTLQSKMIC